jgi:hypothetical protein
MAQDYENMERTFSGSVNVIVGSVWTGRLFIRLPVTD